MPPFQVKFIKAAPPWLRARLLLLLAGRLVHQTYSGSRAVSRLRRGQGSVDVRQSIFCAVREPVPQPLCGFYAAAFSRLHALFDLSARIEVVSCRGAGGRACQMTLTSIDNGAGGSAP
jgi:hypothetical protein